MCVLRTQRIVLDSAVLLNHCFLTGGTPSCHGCFNTKMVIHDWIGSRDNWQETPMISIVKTHGFRWRFSLKPDDWGYLLVMTKTTIEHGPCIVDFPINDGDFPYSLCIYIYIFCMFTRGSPYDLGNHQVATDFLRRRGSSLSLQRSAGAAWDLSGPLFKETVVLKLLYIQTWKHMYMYIYIYIIHIYIYIDR